MGAENGAKLRFEFIGMMFALAIAQVGIEIGDFYSYGFSLTKNLFVLSHLALSVYIISSSWIGWQKSKSKGNQEQIVDSFSLSYLILLIDLLLVIFYFIIVKGVEKPLTNGTITPDSKNEIFWSMVIFGTYFLWDLLTKLINIIDHNNLKIKLDFKVFRYRAYQSLLCLGLVYYFINPLGIKSSKISVVLVDLSLIFTFALFRGLKSTHIFESNSNRIAKTIRVIAYIILPIMGLTITLLLNYFKYD